MKILTDLAVTRCIPLEVSQQIAEEILREQNRVRYWWQSYMTRNGELAQLPELTDIPNLARSLSCP